MQTFLLAAIAITSGALGNFFIKLASKELPLSFSFETMTKLFFSPTFLLGVVFMVGSFPIYALALQRLPLSFGFPLIQNLAFVLLLFLSYLFLKEQLTVINFIGILLLIIGLFLAAAK